MLKKYITLTIIILMAFSSFIVYWPVQDFGFVDFDDAVYVTENQHIRMGLSFDSMGWAFTNLEAGFWHPLTWLSHILDYHLYRMNAGGHHWTSVILHTGSTVLLFLFLIQATGSIWCSSMVAGFFALHPLHVESVAWVAERKDVLSALFWMLVMCSYLYYARRPVWSRYVLVLMCFFLGIMSKPMLVTLPFVLLLLDYWPLGRIAGAVPSGAVARCCDDDSGAAEIAPLPLPRLILEKLPFLLIAVLSVAVTFIAAHKIGAVPGLGSFPLDVRLANALTSSVLYLYKMVWPVDLAVFYPYPGLWPFWAYGLSGLLLLFISMVVFLLHKSAPYLAVGWLWYLGTLIPVIGIIQVGYHSMADRYTYIPLTGIFIMVVWGGAALFRRWRIHRYIFLSMVLSIILLFSVVTRQQLSHWRNSETLFSHAIKVTKNNYLAHNNLGSVFMNRNEYDLAIQHFRKVIDLKPKYVVGHTNLATAYMKKGDLERAAHHFKNALIFKPDHLAARRSLGDVYARLGDFKSAAAQYRVALAISPGDAELQNNLGVALAREGEIEQGIYHIEKAVQLNPKYIEAVNNLSILKKDFIRDRCQQ